MLPPRCGVPRDRGRRRRQRGASFSLSCRRGPRLVLLAAAVLLQFATARADSDLVQRLYKLEQAGGSADTLSISSSALPSAVTKRLDAKELAWDSLSGLQQRALLWDSGYVARADDASALVQVYTACGRTMGDLLPDVAVLDELYGNSTTASCAIDNCGSINHYVSSACATDPLVSATLCAVAASDMTNADAETAGVVWAEDGQSMDVPSPVLRRHSQVNATYNLYAIHVTSSIFTGQAMCETNGNFIVPCRDKGAASDADLCAVTAGAAMDVWLEYLAVPEPSSFSTAAVVMMVLEFAVILGLSSAIWYLVRHRKLLRDKQMLDAAEGAGLLTPADVHLLPDERLTPMEVFFGARPRSRRVPGVDGSAGAIVATTRAEISLSNDQLCRKSSILRKFVAEPTIVTKRISFAQLTFLRLMAKGGMGEVWLGQYEARYVAMKCLLPSKREDVPSLEQFSDEIRMASVLEHPRIVGFIGVAWQSLLHLCAITEYMERSDLEALLALPAASSILSWPKEKISIALDVAEALVYLHSLVPVVIHRDLKSKNVLLDRHLRAKLSDFGLSRARSVEDTMTNGVGTILWSAPEVLEGNQYDEKADIFSFGIVLSEIDTCALPYGFTKDRGAGGGGGNGAGGGLAGPLAGPAAGKMKSMQIVHLVSEGKLLPTFRDDCPPALVNLAQRCLRLDSAERPTAMEVVYELRSTILPMLRQQQQRTDELAAATVSASTTQSTSSSDPAAEHSSST